MQRGKNRRERQFFNNLDYLLGGYENGKSDFGEEEYPNLTADEWVEFIFPEIYHMKSNGRGFTAYGDMICGDLRFLGKAWMVEQLISEVRKEGWLIE